MVSAKWIKAFVNSVKSDKSESSEKDGKKSITSSERIGKASALVRGHAVRKQAAITLRCMQALVRVQARVRARRVRLSLESQTEKQKLKQQLANEARIQEIEEGWCHSVGSVEEIQAKLLKRQEAAAKRERAMAYAILHQRQAGIRQVPDPSGFEPDKSSWGWNWLERWMAVRPWENRFLDINLRDGVKLHETGSAEDKSATQPQLKYSSKKTLPSNVPPNLASQRTGPANFDGHCSSPHKSAGLTEPSNTQLSKTKYKANVDDSFDEANSRPAYGSRLQSNPKERFTQADKQAKKHLSLANNGTGQGIQVARNPSTHVKGIHASQKFFKDRTKLNGKGDSNPGESAPHSTDQ